jgi:hypothetical protein
MNFAPGQRNVRVFGATRLRPRSRRPAVDTGRPGSRRCTSSWDVDVRQWWLSSLPSQIGRKWSSLSGGRDQAVLGAPLPRAASCRTRERRQDAGTGVPNPRAACALGERAPGHSPVLGARHLSSDGGTSRFKERRGGDRAILRYKGATGKATLSVLLELADAPTLVQFPK